MATFKELGVSSDFRKALKEMKIVTPTEIQEKAIPFLINSGEDFIGQAQTGTGKTAAFGLPILQRVNPKDRNIQALVLAPTRELCQQIAKQLFKFTKYSEKIFTESVYGGAPIDNQISNLKRPTQIVVATPGRLVDLLERKAINLKNINTVVLDEADEMLSMGFKKDLDKILMHTQAFGRKTWLFSATMPTGIRDIIKNYLAFNANKVTIDKKNAVNTDIEHKYVICQDQEKLRFLIEFLKSQYSKRGIVFCKTKKAAQTLVKQLQSKNQKCDAIHGDLTQKERDKVMRAFKNESLSILISTDVAARGIDVKNLAYVVHYNLPEHLDYYTHRSGRTGRAGEKGFAISFIEHQELRRLKHIAKELHIKLEKVK